MEADRNMLENEGLQDRKYLIFSIGEESYGILIQYVIEIIGIEEITKVPELPNHVKGIINLRGKIIPVIDLRLRFKKEERAYDDRTCIIVIDIEGILFGLIVDRVKEVASINETHISAPPTVNHHVDNTGGFIEGVGRMNDEIWLFIDCKKLMEEPELALKNESRS